MGKGREFEEKYAKDKSLPDPMSTTKAEFKIVLQTIRDSIPRDATKWTRMSCSFTNQTLAQLDLLENMKSKKYKNDVYLLPKELDEKVARLHLPALGAELTTLTKEQADYIGVKG